MEWNSQSASNKKSSLFSTTYGRHWNPVQKYSSHLMLILPSVMAYLFLPDIYFIWLSVKWFVLWKLNAASEQYASHSVYKDRIHVRTYIRHLYRYAKYNIRKILRDKDGRHVRYWRKFRKRKGEEYEEEDPDSSPSRFKHGPFKRKKEHVSDEYLLYRSIEMIGWKKKKCYCQMFYIENSLKLLKTFLRVISMMKPVS